MIGVRYLILNQQDGDVQLKPRQVRNRTQGTLRNLCRNFLLRGCGGSSRRVSLAPRDCILEEDRLIAINALRDVFLNLSCVFFELSLISLTVDWNLPDNEPPPMIWSTTTMVTTTMARVVPKKMRVRVLALSRPSQAIAMRKVMTLERPSKRSCSWRRETTKHSM